MPCSKDSPVYVYLPYYVLNSPREGKDCVLIIFVSCPDPASSHLASELHKVDGQKLVWNECVSDGVNGIELKGRFR